MNYFLFISAMLEPFFYKLVYMSIVATVVGLIIYGITRIFKNKISPKWVSRIWLLFIICLIIPMQFRSVFSIYNLVPKNLEYEFSNIKNARNANSISDYKKRFPLEFKSYLNTALNTGEIEEKQVDEITKNFENDLKELDKTYSPFRIANILPFLWGFIAMTLTFLYIIVYINFVIKLRKSTSKDERLDKILAECKKEMHIKRKIKIVYQDVISMPSIFGIFSIKILINSDAKELSDKELSYIIKHELAHYKRKDNILNLFITILRCIYIFNPIVVFFLLRKVKKDLELATDELAMKDNSQEEQKEYLKTLVVLSERKPDKFLVQTLCLSDEKKNLERRIDSLKLFDKFKKNSKQIGIVSIILIALLFTTCFTRNYAYMNATDIYNLLANKVNYDTSNYYVKIVQKGYVYEEVDTIEEEYIKGNDYKNVYTFTENGILKKSTQYSNYEKGYQSPNLTEQSNGKKYYHYYDNGDVSKFYSMIDTSNDFIENLKYSNNNFFHYVGIEEVNGKDCYLIEYSGFSIDAILPNLKIEKYSGYHKTWVDCETGLILKEVHHVGDNINYTTECYYEFGIVTDEDFILPDLSDYTQEEPYYVETIDFYELKNEILNNPENSDKALSDFSMIENLPDGVWEYSYSNEYYLLNNEYVFELNFDNYNNEEYYKLIVSDKTRKLVSLEEGKLNEVGELIVTKTEY